ncbi:MAG: prevent-host-death family protein [Omnitrophica bacterium RIFCSPHIGHO2_02_FULL_51_18]|nr:MAG: prevent-host-death family protein [Omnitrophica bacterium RIFCSPHIGHO2_02_FULL_51_18]
MLKDIPITEARYELTSLPERLSRAHEAVTITRRGKPVLAVLPWDEYEALVETLEIMGDNDMMAALAQGIREFKEGKGIPWEKAKGKLGL